MKFLLDTCVISDFFKKIPNVVNKFEKSSPEQIHISTLTAMEIEYGLALTPARDLKLRPLWTALLKHIQVIPYSYQCAIATAKIRALLKTQGLPIGPYDILIAGTAVAHQLVMVTSNLSEFKRIPELTFEDWR